MRQIMILPWVCTYSLCNTTSIVWNKPVLSKRINNRDIASRLETSVYPGTDTRLSQHTWARN